MPFGDGGRLRSLSKTWLEYLRNFAVVAALTYAAVQSGKWYIYAIAYAGQFAFLALTLSYVFDLTKAWRSSSERKWLRYAINVAVVVAVFLTLNAIIMGISIAIDEWVQSQRSIEKR